MLTNHESRQAQIARFEQQLAEATAQSHKLTEKRVRLQRQLSNLERKQEALVKQRLYLEAIIERLKEQEQDSNENLSEQIFSLFQ